MIPTVFTWREMKVVMRHKLIIDGNAVYEIDDDCIRCGEQDQRLEQKEMDAALFQESNGEEDRLGDEWKNSAYQRNIERSEA